MPNQNLLDDFEKHLHNLRISEAIIIVEGKKDKAALSSLGIEHAFSLDKWPLYKVIEHVANTSKDCIILTDLDAEGKKIYRVLNSGLQERGVRVDNHFRNFLFKHTSLRQIEGMDTFYSKLQKQKFHNI